jgi:hypothetical protein
MKLVVLAAVNKDSAIQRQFSSLHGVDVCSKRYIECNIRRHAVKYKRLSKAVKCPSCHVVRHVGLRQLARCVCGFESCRRHGYMSVVGVVCCQVEVSVTG